MNRPSILVVDSGIGGLSIAKDVRDKVPWVHIDYIADIEHHPYGQKTDSEISDRVKKLTEYCLPRYNPDIAIVACNTASTVALKNLRNTFSIPFIGVVPAIKPAAIVSKTGIIGVLATKGTINGQYTKNLILEFAGNKQVYLHGSPNLVSMAEKKMQGIPINSDDILKDVESLTSQALAMDTIVLACTHFPIIKNELQKLFPRIEHWIDSGEAIGRRTLHCLSELGFSAEGRVENPKNRFIYTSRNHLYDLHKIREYLGAFSQTNINV